MEYFSTIGKIAYEGNRSDNPLAFRFYDPDAVVGGKSMKDQLKFAMSYWHTMCAGGRDMFGAETFDKTYGAPDGMERAFHRADAAFELMQKLDLDYFCFHDYDLIPESPSLRKTTVGSTQFPII